MSFRTMETNNAAWSPRVKRAIYTLVAVTFVLRASLAFRSEERICTKPYIEDAFYSLKTAMHLSQGHGFSVDGIHPTNGVQPLMVVIYAPIFNLAGQDRWLALRYTLFLNALIEALTVLTLARMITTLSRVSADRKEEDSPWRSAPVIGAAMWTFLAPIMTHSVNGLETGLYSLMLLTTSLSYARMRLARARGEAISNMWWVGFGILLGLVVLTRIDAVFFVAAFAVIELLTRQSNNDVALRLRHVATFGVLAVIVSAPWWLYNKLQFGSFMPISGQSQSIWGAASENLVRGTVALADIGTTFFYTPHYSVPAWFNQWYFLGYSVLVFLTLFLFARKLELPRALGQSAHLHLLLPLALAASAGVLYYIFFFGAAHFLPRYFHPMRILWVMLAALAMPFAIHWFRERASQNPWVYRPLLAVAAIAALLFNGGLYTSFYTSNATSDLYLAGRWAAMRPSERVGMEQSATAAFVADNVINLDGKVNFEALKYRAQGKIGEYIVKERINYLADWPCFSEPLAISAAKWGADFAPVDSVVLVRMYRRMN